MSARVALPTPQKTRSGQNPIMSAQTKTDDKLASITQERRRGNRRLQPGNRTEDHAETTRAFGAELAMAHEDLRALIASVQEAQRRDREVYDQQITELKEAEKLAREKYNRLVGRVLVGTGVFATLVYLANWIGPTVVRKAIGVLVGIP